MSDTQCLGRQTICFIIRGQRWASRRLSGPSAWRSRHRGNPGDQHRSRQKMLRRENAKLIVHGAPWQEANNIALSLLQADDAFIHPFDDPLLWHGLMRSRRQAIGLMLSCSLFAVVDCLRASLRDYSATTGLMYRSLPLKRKAAPRSTQR